MLRNCLRMQLYFAYTLFFSHFIFECATQTIFSEKIIFWWCEDVYVCVGRVEQKEKKNIEHHVSNRKYLEDNKPVKLYISHSVYVCQSEVSSSLKFVFGKSLFFFLLFHIWKLIWCRLFLANTQNYRNNVPHYLEDV